MKTNTKYKSFNSQFGKDASMHKRNNSLRIIRENLLLGNENPFKKWKVFIALLLAFGLSVSLFGQDTNQMKNTHFYNAQIKMDNHGQSPSSVRFQDGDQPTVTSFFKEYRKAFDLSGENDMREARISKDVIGNHYRFNQYYKGIEIIGAQFILHEKNGTVWYANGHLVPEIKMDVKPSIGEQAALQAALQSINARVYMWQNDQNETFIKKEQNDASATFLPKGELMLTSGREEMTSENLKLVYRFDIYAQEPLGRYWVDVDAKTGKIVNKLDRIQDVDVTASNTTLYNGSQDVTVDDNGAATFTTQEHTTRGAAILTYDIHNSSNFGAATLFSAGTSTGFSDAAGVSTHFGAEATYDYYLNEHGRNSIDGSGLTIRSYTHYLTNLVNAYWDGSRMLYGDGNGGSFTPLVSLDVCGHELTHGVTQYTSNLIYANESGALNESFSDIFGNLVEFSKEGEPGIGTGSWRVGEDVTASHLGIRNMANPNEFNNPDTYGGLYWGFNEVHNRSGVQNFWFYLLSEGGSGTNDIGYNYNVTGIGINDAAMIAYLNNTSFLIPSSNYRDACDGAIACAEALFGAGSQQVISTAEAWLAVGVHGSANISVTPAELTFYSPLNGSGDGIISISNTGIFAAEDLNWSVAVEINPYLFIDSDNPGGPSFSWIDITGTGTPVVLGDDAYIPVPLPFAFPFYGNNKTGVYISSNGYLTFGSSGSATFTNAPIPSSSAPNDFISPFWDDLNPATSPGGTIHYLSTPTQFIVQYTGIIHFSGGLPFTFEVILNSDGSILFQYLDMQGDVASSTVGVENSNGTAGTQVVFNAPYIHNNLAVRMFSMPTATWISSISPSTGTTSAGNSTDVTVSYDATGLPVGDYTANLIVSSNAANTSQLIVPVTLNVGTPLERIDDLITQVQQLYSDGVLNSGQANSLIVKLNAAKKSLNKGQTNTAINQIQAFINQVYDFIDEEVLTPEQGGKLIADAQTIIDMIQNGMQMNKMNSTESSEFIYAQPELSQSIQSDNSNKIWNS